MRFKGTLVQWNDDRGFGFLEPAGGGERAFCHVSEFGIGSQRPRIGERVTYEVSEDERGRLCATHIRPLTPVQPVQDTTTSPTRWRRIAIVVSVIFAAILVGLAIVGRIPWVVPLFYLCLSLIAMLAYGIDKSAAMNERGRTKETTLHVIALLGGWPGAWVSQQMFRHKTSKLSFQATFIVCAAANVALLAWAVIEPRGLLGKLLWMLPMATF